MEVVVVTTQGVEFREAEQYLPLVSALRRDRIAKKLRDEDKLQALAAGLLLSGELSRRSGIPRERLRYSHGPFGKPCLIGGGVEFSLSHTRGAVCAAFSLGQLIYFLVFGLNLHNGQYSLPGTIACMLFTGLLGYFAAEMLLHKSFRVWRTGRVGALVFSAVLVCFGVAMSLDLTGYEGYTPDAEEVEFVSVYLSSNGDYLSCKLDEPESIERTLAAHRAMIADKARQLSYARTTYETPADAPVDSYLYFTVTYTLTDGRVVRRSYVDCRAFSRELNEPGSVAQTMTALLNCPEAALDRVLGELADDKSNAYLTGGYYDVVSDGAYGEDDGELTSAQANTLVSALRRDYEAGHASNASLFEDTLYSGSFYVELELWYSVRVDEKPTRQPIDTTSSSSGSVCAIVTPGMTCTLEALAGMGIETPATARGF